MNIDPEYLRRLEFNDGEPVALRPSHKIALILIGMLIAFVWLAIAYAFYNLLGDWFK